MYTIISASVCIEQHINKCILHPFYIDIIILHPIYIDIIILSENI